MSDKKDFTDKSKNSNDTFCCIYCTERNDCSVLSVKKCLGEKCLVETHERFGLGKTNRNCKKVLRRKKTVEKIKENTTYKEGDVVVYGSQGICRITGTEKMRVGGKSTVYFILNPVYRKNSKIFVPSDNEKLMEKMHSVIEKDEIDELIRNAAEDTSEWIENDAERKDFFKSALASGDRGKIINVIKTIRLHKTEREESGKRLHQSDEAFLKEAEALIYEEFAVVLGIEPVKVLDYIMDEISKL